MDEIQKIEAKLRRAEAEYAALYAQLVAAKAAKATLAERIVAAGEKRRGCGSSAPPRDPLAAAIVRAGRRARGEETE